MPTKEELLKDISELVNDSVFTQEEGDVYNALLEQEEPRSVVQKLFIALQEKNIDFEGEMVEGVTDFVVQMKKVAEVSGDESLKAGAIELGTEMENDINEYEADVKELEREYLEEVAPALKNASIEEQKRKIAEV